jgi:hypothetical protein
VVRIRGTRVVTSAGRAVASDGKTPGARATVPIDAGTAAALEAHRERRRELLEADVLDAFEVGELAPERVLFVDTHQERPEIERRSRDMERRGLEVPDGRMYAWHVVGFDVADEAWCSGLEAAIGRTGAGYVWVDAGSHLVDDPKDDRGVGALFDFLSDVMGRLGVAGIGMTLVSAQARAG